MDHEDVFMDVIGKRTLDYVFDSISRFNIGAKRLTLRAVGGNLAMGVEVARILEKEFGLKIVETSIENVKIKESELSSLRITIESSHSTTTVKSSYKLPDSSFIDYPIYHILFDLQLNNHGKLQILRHNKIPLMTVTKKNGMTKFRRDIVKDDDIKAFYGLGDAWYRSGLLFPKNWERIASKLSQFDDIILGIDTNVLYHCNISEHLLPTLTLIDPKQYVHTPNWILLIVSSAVMHEIEEAANIRDNGYLQVEGRMGFRALEEIIDLSQGTDIPGVSLIIVGGANPILDTRVEIQGLREDFLKREKLKKNNGLSMDKILRLSRSLKTSSGDMIIRDQFKEFLKEINFHKGTYFLTCDKSNSALARTEGLHPIYFPFPHGYYERHDEVQAYQITNGLSHNIKNEIPIGKLIYEMAVQFSSIIIKFGNESISMQCDSRGETLDHWVSRRLRINRKDFARLIPGDGQLRFDLGDLSRCWSGLNESFMALDDI